MKQERYRKIETYSTGMRQKVKFAAAIDHDPELLILDEPTSGLDPEERENLLNRIRILADDAGKSVLISTHILPDVQAVCDHAIIIAAGKLVMSESLENLNRTSSPTINVRIMGDEEAFVREAKKAGLNVEQNVDLSWKISGDQAQLADQIWQAANRVNTTILAMSPAKNDLETIFIEAIGADHANS